MPRANSTERNISDLRTAMEAHFIDDAVRFKNIENKLDTLITSINDYHQKMEPVMEWFQNITWGKALFINILKVLGSIIGIIIGGMTVIKFLK